jgi:hypothetical protein
MNRVTNTCVDANIFAIGRNIAPSLAVLSLLNASHSEGIVVCFENVACTVSGFKPKLFTEPLDIVQGVTLE